MARVTKLASWWWSWALSLCSGAICSCSCPTDHGLKPAVLSRLGTAFCLAADRCPGALLPHPTLPHSPTAPLFTDTKTTCGYTELDEKHKMLWENPYKFFGQPNISEQNLILYSFYFLIMCVFTTYTHTHTYTDILIDFIFKSSLGSQQNWVEGTQVFQICTIRFLKHFGFTAKLSGRYTGFPDMYYPFTGLASCQNICFLKDYHCKRARVI